MAMSGGNAKLGQCVAPAARHEWLRGLMDWIFGYDFFVSYAHDDGSHYPRRLRDRLEATGFRAFLDTRVYVAGEDLQAGTRRRVRMSSYLVVVARPCALRSKWVLRELQTYLGKGRAPIVININGALEAAGADPEILRLLKDRLYIREAQEDPDGEPSEVVLEGLRRSFQSTRQEVRRLRLLTFVAGFFALLAGAATILAFVAYSQSQIADQQRRQAMGVAADALARDPGRGMEALALAVEAVGPRPERAPSGVVSGLVAALGAARGCIPIRGVDGQPLQHAALFPGARRVVTADKSGTLRLWDTASGAPIVQWVGPADLAPVDRMKVAPDGKTLLTTSKTIAKLLSAENGRELFQFEGHNRVIVSAAYSPNSTRAVTGDESGVFLVWDVVAGRLLWAVPKHKWDARLAVFSNDGQFLLTATDQGDIRFWDVERRTCKSCWNGKPLAPIFSPQAAVIGKDGRQAIIIGTRTVVLWNTISGEPIEVRFLANRESALAASWNHDRPLAIMAQGTSPYDGTTELYEGRAGVKLARFDHAWRCGTAAFSASGDWAVTGGDDGVVRVWKRDPRTDTWEASATLTGHDQYVHSVELSEDGRRVLSLDTGGSARVWDLQADQSSLRIVPPGGASFAAYTRGGTHLISHNEGILGCWDARTGTLSWKKPIKRGSRAAVFADGTRVIFTATSGQVAVYDATKGKRRRAFPVQASARTDAKISRDGRRVLLVCVENNKKWVEVWDTDGDQFSPSFDVPRLSSVAIAPDGSKVVVTENGVVRLLNIDTAQSTDLVHQSSRGRFFEAEFSPDSRRVIAPCSDGTATLWDAERATLLGRLEGHTNAVIGAHFSPDGTKIVTAGEDHVARIWDGVTGKHFATLSGHFGMLADARFSPDGRRILTCSRDGTARYWDARTADLLGVFGRQFDVEATMGVFSPDGRQVLIVRHAPGSVGNGSVTIYPASVPQYLAMAAPLLRHQPQFDRVRDVLLPYLGAK